MTSEQSSVDVPGCVLDEATSEENTGLRTTAAPVEASYDSSAPTGTGKLHTCENRTTRVASPPFDRPGTDLIVRSSDGVDFKVYKWILEDVCQVDFDDVFTLPQPTPLVDAENPVANLTTEPVGSEAVIELTETSETLYVLLRLCYPAPPVPTFATFEEAKLVLAAAEKYALEEVSDTLVQAMSAFIRAEPLRVYAFAIGYGYGLHDLVGSAARSFLDTDSLQNYSAELEDISGSDYHRLLVYRERCQAALRPLTSRSWPTKTHGWTWRACTNCVSHKGSNHVRGSDCGKCGSAQWYNTMVADMKAALEVRPSPVALCDAAFVDAALVKACECSICKSVVHGQMRKYLALVSAEIEQKLSEVELEFR